MHLKESIWDKLKVFSIRLGRNHLFENVLKSNHLS